jgi:hypothetical protein
MQQYAVYILFLLQNHSTCFRCRPHPSSGVHKTVVTATGTSHMFVQLPHSNVVTLEWGSYTNIWLVPVAVTTVLRTPDDGCGRHPKHVERFCSKIKHRLHIVASRWTFINIEWLQPSRNEFMTVLHLFITYITHRSKSQIYILSNVHMSQNLWAKHLIKINTCPHCPYNPSKLCTKVKMS